jgi:2-polyprenyl-3-methyl-5-hydroxy-6-metoxy-1,4-benzoquinol methylase
MTSDSQRAIELWNRSAEAWIEFMRRGDVSRSFLDPLVHALCGPVKGLRVLDIGCGEGRFSRQLQAKGANVVGIEPSMGLLAEAQERGDSEFRPGTAENLPCGDAEFDLALFYLVLIDVPDFRAAIHEAFRVLKPGGRVVVANITSMRSASEAMWVRDETGQKLGWLVEFYHEERGLEQEWQGLRVINYHRPLCAYFQAFLAAGFQLEHFDEPVPNEHFLAQHPRERDHHKAPNFNLFVWRKPVS